MKRCISRDSVNRFSPVFHNIHFPFTHLVRLRAGQAARQRSAVGGQSGCKRRATVCQNGLQVTVQVLRTMTQKKAPFIEMSIIKVIFNIPLKREVMNNTRTFCLQTENKS